MSGIQIVVPGLAFDSNNAGYIPPVADALEYINFFADGTDPTRNLAPGKPAVSSVGSPQITGNALIVTTGAKYLITHVSDVAEQTYLAVAAPDTSFAGSQQLIGNYSGEDGGVVLRFNGSSPANNSLFSSVSGGFKEASRSMSTTGARLLIGRRSFSANVQELYTGNGTTTRSLDGQAMDASPNSIRVGSTHTSAVFGNLTPIYAAAIWNRRLTDAEIETVRSYMLRYFTIKGVPVDV